MEKRKPHYDLAQVHALVTAGKVKTTRSAREGGVALGFDFEAMLAVALSLTPQDFYKSMTTYANTKIWQDVYHANSDAGKIYLKISIIDDLLIVSFKEL